MRPTTVTRPLTLATIPGHIVPRILTAIANHRLLALSRGENLLKARSDRKGLHSRTLTRLLTFLTDLTQRVGRFHSRGGSWTDEQDHWAVPLRRPLCFIYLFPL